MAELDDLLRIADGRAELARLGDRRSHQRRGAHVARHQGRRRRRCRRPASHTDAVAFSTTFLAAAQPGPASVATEILRIGRSFSTAEVTVSQDDKVRLRHTATFADLDANSEPVHLQEAPPELPDPEPVRPGRPRRFRREDPSP